MTSPVPKPRSGWLLRDAEANAPALARLASLLRGELPEQRPRGHRSTTGRLRPERPVPRQPSLWPGCRLGCTRELLRGGEMRAPGQCPCAGPAQTAQPRVRSGPARAVRIRADRGVLSESILTAGRGWPCNEAAGFHRGLASVRNHSDRADLWQVTPSFTEQANCRWAGESSTRSPNMSAGMGPPSRA